MRRAAVVLALALSLTAACHHAPPPVAAEVQPAAAITPLTRDTLVADDGARLAVWSRRPAGRVPVGAILLVHGRTWSSRPNWDLESPTVHRSVLTALAARGWAAYALDLRGYGASPRDSSGWDTPTRAALDVAGALDWVATHAGTGTRPALLGYSNGALVAMLVAQRYPDRVSSVVLYGFPRDFGAPPPSEAARVLSAPPAGADAVPARAATTAQGAAEDFRTPDAAPPAVVNAYVAAALASDPVRADWRGLQEWDLLSPPAVRVPTLLLQGERDQYVGATHPAALFTQLGAADRSWVVLPDADHVAHVEDGQAGWVDAVLGFVGRRR